ncbi:MAG: hypothetical protein KDK35_21945, partial [Leptospiraceae bacterium]|nr:hypothetical protein [Leptospiraceae bacterium]
MEFLLLLLLGGLAAGVGLWATMGDREKDADDANQDDRSGSGPRSSPDLPGAGGGGAESDVSRPVILGGRKPFDDLKKAMEHAPASVPGQVVTGDEADRKKKQPEDRPLRRKPLKVTFN